MDINEIIDQLKDFDTIIKEKDSEIILLKEDVELFKKDIDILLAEVEKWKQTALEQDAVIQIAIEKSDKKKSLLKDLQVLITKYARAETKDVKVKNIDAETTHDTIINNVNTLIKIKDENF